MTDLNEDFIHKPKKKSKPVVTENLEEFYGMDIPLRTHSISATGLTQAGPSIDGFTFEIIQGDQKISLANEKFVHHIKEQMHTFMIEMEKIKRYNRNLEREVQMLKSKLESTSSNLNSKVNTLTSQTNQIRNQSHQ